MLSAMIVNKQHLTTGQMETETLVGFVKAAIDLGYEVEDPVTFLHGQQEACFKWGDDADRGGCAPPLTYIHKTR